jgi:hypothetical protein
MMPLFIIEPLAPQQQFAKLNAGIQQPFLRFTDVPLHKHISPAFLADLPG